MFIARKSNHIQEDIKRNWSSWNFGQEGFSGTKYELETFLSKATEDNAVWISGFWIYESQVKDFQFSELYSDYWVAVDNVNSKWGLSAIDLNAFNIEDAIIEAETRTDYFGDGISFDANYAVLVYSNNDLHVFEIADLMNQSIIVVVQDNIPECWGNFKKMCLAKGYPYFTLARLKFPIEYKGVTIHKVIFN